MEVLIDLSFDKEVMEGSRISPISAVYGKGGTSSAICVVLWALYKGLEPPFEKEEDEEVLVC